MRELVLLVLFVVSASPTGAQEYSFFCPGGEVAYRAEPHDVARVLTSVHAVTTDGFGAHYSGPAGREVRAEGIGATTILSDGALAWRTRTEGQAVLLCGGQLQVVPDLNLGRERGLRLAVEVGNETGDPGPLRYLDPSLPNVDKIGPDYEGTLSLGPSTTSFRWRDFLPTDSAIAPRVFDVLDGRFPKRKGLAGTTAHSLGRASVNAYGLLAEDLPFEETLGREVPTLRRHLGAELVGTMEWTRYEARVASAWLDRPSWSALDVPGPDWREVSADVQASRWEPAIGLNGFARVRPVWASGPGLADGSMLWGEVGVEGSPDITPLFGHPFFGVPLYSVRFSAGPSGVGGGISVRPRALSLGPVSIIPAVRADRQLPEAAPGLPFWVSRGYSGLASEATPLTLEGAPRPVESVSLNATASRRWNQSPRSLSGRETSAGVFATVDVDARRGETVLLPDFRLADDAVAVSGPVRAVTAEGAVAEAKISGQWSRFLYVSHGTPTVHTTVRGWARTRFVLAGDDAFRAHLDRQPAVRIGASAEHSPDGKLNLNARLEWRSATHWEGWPEPEVPAALLADLGMDYTFRAFTLTLTGRNVLGAPEQTHPLGATLDGRLFVRLAARAGS